MGIIKTGKIQHSGHPTDIDVRVTALEAKNVRALWFAEISSGASGTITPPTGGTIILDQWAAGIDAVTSTLTTTRNPAFESAKTSAGVIITATLDVAGAWTISGTPSAYPIAILYVYDVAFTSFDKTKSLVEIETDQGLKTTDSPTFAGLTDSSLSASKVMVSDANKKHASGTNTDAEIASAVSLKHTQGSDTALGTVGTKNPPIDADLALYRDSAATNVLVTSTWTQIKAFLKTYFDTIYALLSGATFTGAVNTAYATVASHATTSAIWAAAGNVVNFTGTETITDFPAAPQAGAQRTLICAGACVFTHAGSITVQGAATYTAAAGDVIIVTATTTTAFKVNILNQASKPAILLAGTAGKTITVTQGTSLDEAVAMSSKAPKASPTFTGDVTLSGKVTNATLPAFLASVTADLENVTGDGTSYQVIFGTESYDQANNFNGTSTFTAPVTGKYHFDVCLTIKGLAAGNTPGNLYIDTTAGSIQGPYANIGATIASNQVVWAFGGEALMPANDTAIVTIAIGGGTKVVDIGTGSTFSGHLIC